MGDFDGRAMGADDGVPSEAQVEAAESGRPTHPWEPHAGGLAGRLNWLRAAVLGANDGICLLYTSPSPRDS